MMKRRVYVTMNVQVNPDGIVRPKSMIWEDGVEYAESLLNLETNTPILQQWKRFNSVQHKRRRAYKKVIG